MAKLKIVYKKLGDLVEADYNPRQITEKQFDDLCESLKNLDCIEPIIVNSHPGRENVIVGGHQRVKAMKRLAMDECPCVVVDYDIEREREANIRLNKNTGEWNFETLANHFDVDLLVEFGFEPGELTGFDIEIPEPDSDDNCESVSFSIKCDNLEELNILHKKFNVSGKDISFAKFLEIWENQKITKVE